MPKKRTGTACGKARRRNRPANPKTDGYPCNVHSGGLYATFVARLSDPPFVQVLTVGTASTLDAIEQTAKDALNRWGSGKEPERGAIVGTWGDGRPYRFAPPAVFEACHVLDLIRGIRAGGVAETDRDRMMMRIGALGERLIVRQNEHLAATSRSVHAGGVEGADVQHGPKAKRDAMRVEIKKQFEALRQADPERKLADIDGEIAEARGPSPRGPSPRTVRRYRAR